MDEHTMLESYVPENIQDLIRNGQMHKVASAVLGLDACTVEKIAQYMGVRMQMRKQACRQLLDSVDALYSLRKTSTGGQ